NGGKVHKFEFTKDYCLELLSKFPKKQLFNNTKAFLEYNKCFFVQIIMTREKIDISKGTWIGNISEVNYYLELIDNK
ncbi:MAG: hypothetical protein WC337_11090, partial [Candidatus Muiribacteriota bacterium]